jgi:hypothetical protein
MNTAQDLLQQARAAGYILTPKDGGLINIRPRPTDELREAVKAHKAELLALLSASPANDSAPSSFVGGITVTDQQRAFLKREPLVSLEDLHQIQRHLLRHLADCRECGIEEHLYCHQAERTSNGYSAYLTEFPDAAQRHADYVAVVIQSRIRGLQAGFRALDALAHQKGATGPETACRHVYGIEARPAELAFVNHFTACSFCYPRSGKYCLEGRMLHEAVAREATQ